MIIDTANMSYILIFAIFRNKIKINFFLRKNLSLSLSQSLSLSRSLTELILTLSLSLALLLQPPHKTVSGIFHPIAYNIKNNFAFFLSGVS